MQRARRLARVGAALVAAGLAGWLLIPPAALAGPGEILICLRDDGERGTGGGGSAGSDLSRNGTSEVAGRLDQWLERDAAGSPDPGRAEAAAAARRALASAEVARLLPGSATSVRRSLSPMAQAAAARLTLTFAIRLAENVDPAPLLPALAGLDEVAWVSPNRAIPVAAAEAAPGGQGDPRRAEQWYLDRVGAESAWAVTRGDPGVLIAVIDTGVFLHEDLLDNLWVNDDPPGNASLDDDAVDQDQSGAVEDWERADDDDNGYVDDTHGYDFVDAPRIGGPGDAVERDNDVTDDSGHGTAMAGVIGAVADNGIGIAGLAPGCTVMPVRAGFNPGLIPFSGVLEEDDAAAAIVYAAENEAAVINMSWGDTLLSPVIGDAIAYARELGAVLVAAAGNSQFDGMHYPSGLEGVVAAGASQVDDHRTIFSNFGPALDLLAPGSNILTTAGESGYVSIDGTSLSAPLVAAASALLRSRDPELRAEEVAAILFGSTEDLVWPGWDRETGHGRLDAGRALTVSRAASVAIHTPAAGTGVDVETPVVITAEGLRLDGYALEVGTGRNPTSFRTLASASGRQVVEDTVAIWQTKGLAAGEYTLRLRAIDESEGLLEERALVMVDHTGPDLTGESISTLWVEDRLVPFVFFTTDDLARGAIDVLDQDSNHRRVDEAFLTRDHIIRLPEDLAPGNSLVVPSAINAARLAAFGRAMNVAISTTRAHTHALAPTAARLAIGELAPRLADLDQDGDQDLVLMAEESGSLFGPLVVHSATGDDAYAESDTLPHRLLPRDVGDTDGDGRMEILASGLATACLLESPGPLAYPTEKVWEDASGFAIGFAALAGGPAILGIQSTSLIVYRSTGDAGAWTESVAANFSAGTGSLAPTYFAGDVDGDGAVEVVIGDSDGDLLAFRDLGSGALAAAYSLRLPVAASPLVSGGDLDGDGRAEIVVDLPAGLEVSSEALLERRRHRLMIVTAQPGSGFAVSEMMGIAGIEESLNAVRVASIDADAEGEILVIAAPDLYVFDRIPEPAAQTPAPPAISTALRGGMVFFPSGYQAGVRGATLAVGEGDGDGRVEVFAGDGAEVIVLEARDLGIPGPLPPDGLRARFLAGGDVELAWNASAPLYRLYRAPGLAMDCAQAPFLAEMSEPAYRDTTASDLSELTYWVTAVDLGTEGQCSRPLHLLRGQSPMVLTVVAEQARSIRIGFSTAMDESADRLENYRLFDPTGTPLPLSSVVAAGEGRARVLILGRDLEGPGSHRLVLGSLRSAAGAPLAGDPEVVFLVPAGLPAPPPLYLESAAGSGAEVELRLSAAPDPATGSDPRSYRISGGFVIAGAALDGYRVRLALDPQTPLRPGIFQVGLAPGLRGAAGERVVPGAGDESQLVIGGELVAFPNPYDSGRAVSDGVSLVGLAPGDQVVLLDALGREVLRIDARNSGSAFIPVRSNPQLSSGVYLYRVEGSTGSRVGKLAILR